MKSIRKMIAIDASTEACSVALRIDGATYLKHKISPRMHAELILPMIDSLLEEHHLALGDLDAFAVSIGPGAFTGVRLSISVVQGLAYALQKPVIPLSTLEILAYGAASQAFSKNAELEDVKVAVAMDARMDEVYWGCFHVSQDKVTPLQEAGVFAPEQVPFQGLTIDKSWLFAGTGWGQYSEKLQQQLNFSTENLVEILLPQADWLTKIAARRQELAVDAANLQALYLRDKVADTIQERLKERLESC